MNFPNEYKYFYSCEWWKENIRTHEEIESTTIHEMENFNIAWEEWFLSGHQYALRDQEFFELGIDKYLNFVGMIIKKRK